jgi:putative oxidoreductase
VHWGKPIWNTAGGAELPLTNMAAAAALAIAGPGRYSIDRMLGIRLPGWIGFLGLIAIGVSLGRSLQPQMQQPQAPDERSELEARDQMEDAHTQAAQEAEREGSLL